MYDFIIYFCDCDMSNCVTIRIERERDAKTFCPKLFCIHFSSVVLDMIQDPELILPSVILPLPVIPAKA